MKEQAVRYVPKLLQWCGSICAQNAAAGRIDFD